MASPFNLRKELEMANGKLSKGGAGGGMGSKSAAKVSTYFIGQPSQRVSPGGADQQGQAMSNDTMQSSRTLPNPATPLFSGAMPNSALGNQCAVETKCSTGGSRSVMPAGGQGQHGPANPGMARPGANKPIFPGFK